MGLFWASYITISGTLTLPLLDTVTLLLWASFGPFTLPLFLHTVTLLLSGEICSTTAGSLETIVTFLRILGLSSDKPVKEEMEGEWVRTGLGIISSEKDLIGASDENKEACDVAGSSSTALEWSEG